MKSMLIGVFCGLCLFSCSKKVGPTTVQVEDSIRHYYPMVLSDNLELSYNVKNIGDNPLVITDIQPSCGCIVEGDNNERIILPRRSLLLHFKFYSGKNIGYVHHTIRIFGNVLPQGMVSLIFDVNVVPPSENTPDYEEIYKDKEESDKTLYGSMKEKVNGKASEKGYYVGSSDDVDSRSHKQFFWRK